MGSCRTRWASNLGVPVPRLALVEAHAEGDGLEPDRRERRERDTNGHEDRAQAARAGIGPKAAAKHEYWDLSLRARVRLFTKTVSTGDGESGRSHLKGEAGASEKRGPVALGERRNDPRGARACYDQEPEQYELGGVVLPEGNVKVGRFLSFKRTPRHHPKMATSYLPHSRRRDALDAEA